MISVAFDVTFRGVPRDLTGTVWHAPLHAPDGRPVGAATVTISTPPDATTPCRLILETPDDLPADSTVTLEQHTPVRRVWWTGPVPEPCLLATEDGDVITTEDGDAIDVSTVTVLDLHTDGCRTHQTRDGERRTAETARVAFRDLSHYTRVRGPGARTAAVQRLEQVKADFPGAAGPADWLADPDAFARLAHDMIKQGLTPPGQMGPRQEPDPAAARRYWQRLTSSYSVHRPKPEPAATARAPKPKPTGSQLDARNRRGARRGDRTAPPEAPQTPRTDPDTPRITGWVTAPPGTT